jgi:acyl-CoA synthetase (AMP-forming)/AMP-acid ligase II
MAEAEDGSYLPTSFAAHLWRVASAASNELAIVQGESTLTWAEFDERAARVAGYLRDRGLEPGGCVAIAATNCPEYLVALLAAFKAAACVANVNYRYRRDEIAYVLNDCGAQAVIFGGELADEVIPAIARTPTCRIVISIGAPPELAPKTEPVVRLEDIATSYPSPAEFAVTGDKEWLLYTGGTTGMPKAVVGTEGERLGVLYSIAVTNLGVADTKIAPERAAACTAAAVPRPVYFTAAPLMHGTGLYCALIALVSGATIVLAASRTYDAEDVLRTLASRRVTDMHVVGDAMMLPVVDALDAAQRRGHHYDLSSLARIQSAGTVWSRRSKERMLAHADITQLDMIAATEGGPFAIAESSRRRPPKDGAAFVLAPSARLLGPEGDFLQPDSFQVGQLAVATTPNARYLGDERKTDQTFRDIDGVRYAVPGDLAAFNTDGTLRLLGRGSSVINTGGEKVYVDEVEAVLRNHPHVADAVVVGIADERLGQVVGAVLTVRSGAELDAATVGAFVAASLSGFKKPRVVRVVPEIRRLASAKPDLNWAKAVLASSGAELPARAPTESVES